MSDEPQRGDLPGAQPQPRQQRDDREVPPPDPRAPIAARQQPRERPASSALTNPASRQLATDGTAPVRSRSISPSTCKKRNSTRSRVTMHFAEPTLQPPRLAQARTRSPPRRPASPAPASPPSSPATTRTRARRRHSYARSTATPPAAHADTTQYRSISTSLGVDRHRRHRHRHDPRPTQVLQQRTQRPRRDQPRRAPPHAARVENCSTRRSVRSPAPSPRSASHPLTSAISRKLSGDRPRPIPPPHQAPPNPGANAANGPDNPQPARPLITPLPSGRTQKREPRSGRRIMPSVLSPNPSNHGRSQHPLGITRNSA